MTALEYRTCPGCGVRLPVSEAHADGRYNASAECRQLYGELAAYTLTRGDPAFLHQLAVDAYGAQHAGEGVRPIATAFALIGLYLTFERGYSGRQVQAAHGRFARRAKRWPRFDPPPHAGTLTVADVLRAQPGADRDTMLRRWGMSVWEAWSAEHARVASLVARLWGD
jgi:Family of unknown function (DUF5946)